MHGTVSAPAREALAASGHGHVAEVRIVLPHLLLPDPPRIPRPGQQSLQSPPPPGHPNGEVRHYSPHNK
jgi:hypothetical protein